MISVVIPAYNEETVIERTLHSVLHAMKQEPGEVIVACNGCKDRTVERAKRFGDCVTVLDIERGSKTLALNEGDKIARGFPRFFLDADIELSDNAFSATASLLRGGEIHAAAPMMRCISDGASWPVKAFYRTWLSRPYQLEGHLGSGFVGISEQGRSRFQEFPSIIADDEYVRRQFQPHERAVVHDAWFSIRTPKDVASLVKVKTRSRLGTLQLLSSFPNLKETASTKPTFMTRWTDALSPSFWAFALITVLARQRANRQWRKKQVHHWERDETSR